MRAHTSFHTINNLPGKNRTVLLMGPREQCLDKKKHLRLPFFPCHSRQQHTSYATDVADPKNLSGYPL
jgi:hypothetical protein